MAAVHFMVACHFLGASWSDAEWCCGHAGEQGEDLKRLGSV